MLSSDMSGKDLNLNFVLSNVLFGFEVRFQVRPY